MKKTVKRNLAALSAASLLLGGGIIGAQAEAPVLTDIPILVPPIAGESQIETHQEHGYVIGSFTVGESREENAIASEDGNLYIYKNDATFVLGAKGEQKSWDDIKAGDVVTFYVDGNAPVTLQYPPHYTAGVVVIEDEEVQVSRKLDVFDEERLSSDGELVLNYDPTTPYYSHSREATLISGKALVFYDMMTMSIPAQTNPLAIVKLVDDEAAVIVPGGASIDNAVDHDYLVGSFTVGESREENAIASENDQIYLNKSDAAFVLGANGEKLSWDDIKVGDVVTYYVDANAPMTLQLPVHYNPAVVVIEDENASTGRMIGMFDEDLLDAEAQLKLNVSLETPYYSHTREAMLISGKALVFYNMMTMSIPAQTNPVAIVRLNGDYAAPGQAADLSAVTQIKIGENVVPHIPVTVNEVQMLPVRVVAEALGMTVEWIDETKSVNVGFASFTIDEDAYTMAKSMPQPLGQAPVLLTIPGEESATTYVPVTFFTEVLGLTLTVDGNTAELAMIN